MTISHEGDLIIKRSSFTGAIKSGGVDLNKVEHVNGVITIEPGCEVQLPLMKDASKIIIKEGSTWMLQQRKKSLISLLKKMGCLMVARWNMPEI